MIRARDFQPPPFHPARPGLVRPVPIDPRGVCGPTPGQARRGTWRRASRGLYLPARFTDEDPQQRTIEAAAILKDGEAVTGWAALHWLGVTWADGRDRSGALDVPLLVADSRGRSRAGITLSRERIRDDDVRVIAGLPITHPLRSVAFEARRATSLAEAVRWLDWGAAFDLVSLAEMRAHLPALAGWDGVPLLRAALELADENVWSPRESRLRWCWRHELGLPHLVTNRPVFDLDGRHVATPDLLDLDSGVAGEYDGAVHLAGRQRARDLRREGTLREVGIEPVTMVAADLADTTGFRRRTTEAIARQRGRPRLWTIEPPAWWTPTWTVEQRRRLPRSRRRPA